jgi:hypothetical protein
MENLAGSRLKIKLETSSSIINFADNPLSSIYNKRQLLHYIRIYRGRPLKGEKL